MELVIDGAGHSSPIAKGKGWQSSKREGPAREQGLEGKGPMVYGDRIDGFASVQFRGGRWSLLPIYKSGSNHVLPIDIHPNLSKIVLLAKKLFFPKQTLQRTENYHDAYIYSFGPLKVHH
ncbi:hypothetical protein VNO77_41887 [Canavalia gladiata]|uniref:Uncharacterized protein n=1 Tax=Canavalia gladiata TaxID=3824 RepID=A0AAN9PQJ1_CANGL